MNLMLGFSPFFIFAIVDKYFGILPALVAGALVSIILLIRDWTGDVRHINLLEAGSALIFTLLASLALIHQLDNWSIWKVRLSVDAGLLLIILVGLLMQKPFSLQYSRRMVSVDVARSKSFFRKNNIISGVWAFAITVLALADLLVVVRPETSLWFIVGISFGALAGAIGFTKWFVANAQRKSLLNYCGA